MSTPRKFHESADSDQPCEFVKGTKIRPFNYNIPNGVISRSRIRDQIINIANEDTSGEKSTCSMLQKKRKRNFSMIFTSFRPRLPMVYFKIGIIFLTGVVLCVILCYRNLAGWLYVHDPVPERIDYLCTFGMDRTREEYALQLWLQKSDAIWIVNTLDAVKFMIWASENGADTTKIIVTDSCESTYEEMLFFNKNVKTSSNKGCINVGLVSSPLHMRRIMIISSFVMKNNIKRFALPIPADEYGLSEECFKYWWKEKYCSVIVPKEIKKIYGEVIAALPGIGPTFRRIFEKEENRQ